MDRVFSLASSTNAIVGSAEAIHLIEQKERLERAILSNDPALTLDTAKALLESTFKTIIADRDSEFDLSKDMPILYKAVKELVTFHRDSDVQGMLEKLLGCIHNWIIQFRNRYGAASHGDDGYYENPVGMIEAELIAYVTDAMVGFLYAKHKQDGNPELLVRIYYNDYPEFNDYFDAQSDSYKLILGAERTFDVPPSRILFATDETLYREILLQFLSSEKEDASVGDKTKANEETAQKLPEPTSFIPEAEEIEEQVVVTEGNQENDNILELLKMSQESKEQEIKPERLVFIAEELSKVLTKLQVVDWQERDTVQAEMKNTTRVLLRKYGYPVNAREYVLKNILDVLVKDHPEIFI